MGMENTSTWQVTRLAGGYSIFVPRLQSSPRSAVQGTKLAPIVPQWPLSPRNIDAATAIAATPVILPSPRTPFQHKRARELRTTVNLRPGETLPTYEEGYKRKAVWVKTSPRIARR